MFFSRRTLQQRLTALRASLCDEAVDELAARLNRPGKDRLAAMWEVMVFHGLARLGQLGREAPLASGRRPDIRFAGEGLGFTADITAVSDSGLDEQNPYHELSQAIEAAKRRLRVPIGGVDLQVRSRVQTSARGERRTLRLPPRARIAEFVQNEVTPLLRGQIDAGQEVLRVVFDDENVSIELTIDPAKSPYSTGGYASYDVPTIKDKNPLYNALKFKAAQLRGAEGLTGVIVGDGDCRALARRQTGFGEFTTQDIVREFLRQYTSVGFVLLLTVEEEPWRWSKATPSRRWITPTLITRRDDPHADALRTLAAALIADMPAPIRNPANAALRAQEAIYDIGFHGGLTMSGERLRMSLREMTETLAGRRTLADNGAKYPEAARALGGNRDSRLQDRFERALAQGRLPVRITVEPGGPDADDDWVEFEFGPPDPAITLFR